MKKSLSLPLVAATAFLLAAAPSFSQVSGPQPPLQGPGVAPAQGAGAGTQAHDLTPPDSASLIAGGGGSFGWLNVVNAATTVSAAMTSDPYESQGYANAPTGTVIEVGFSGGVVNGAGPDLVMLDAQFDSGSYRISSDFDGFVSSVTVTPGAGTLYHAVSYYYELNPGPWSASVMGADVDLTSIGVPSGSSVTALRFETLDAAGDPVTLAKIGGRFTLTTNTLIAGTTGTATATGGTPSGQIGIAYSLTGSGPTAVNTGACGVVSVDLSPPINILTLGNADAAGDLSVSRTIPSGASGVVVYVQAFDFGTCTLSNLVVETIL